MDSPITILRNVQPLFRMVYFPAKIMLNSLNKMSSFLPNLLGLFDRNGFDDSIIDGLSEFEGLVKIFRQFFFEDAPHDKFFVKKAYYSGVF